MIVIIIVLSTLFRLVGINQSFWLDEAVQATISTNPLNTIDWSADFQPPLFYLFAHVWQKIGIHSEWFLRLPSVFFGVATIYILSLLIKKMGFAVGAVFASLLLATAPFHIYFSQEYRMYSFFTFLTTLSWYVLYRRQYARYGFTVFLMFYTHYFSVLVLISQALYILVFKRQIVQQFFKYLALGVAPFIFWLPILAQQFKTSKQLLSVWPEWGNVASVSFWKFPGLLMAKFTVGMTSPDPRWFYALSVLIVGSIFLYSNIQIVLSSPTISSMIKILLPSYLFPQILRLKYTVNRLTVYFKAEMFLIWFFVPVILSWISSPWIRANSPHRLLFVLPAFYTIIGIALAQLLGQKKFQAQRLKRLLLMLFVTLLSINIYFSITYLFNDRWHRENWRSAIAYTDQKIKRGGLVLTEHTAPWATIVWYSKSPDRYIGTSKEMKITERSVAKKLSPYLLNTKSVTLYTYLYELSDPDRIVEKHLTSHSYKLVEEKDFRGIGIIRSFTK